MGERPCAVDDTILVIEGKLYDPHSANELIDQSAHVRISSSYTLVCDETEEHCRMGNDGHRFIEPFLENKYNAKFVSFSNSGSKKLPIVTLVATKRIQPGGEVHAPRGRNYWKYKPNFDTLNLLHGTNCKRFYSITGNDFVGQQGSKEDKKK